MGRRDAVVNETSGAPPVPVGQRVGLGLAAVVLGAALGAAAVVMSLQGQVLLVVAGVLLLVGDVLAVSYLVRFLMTPRGAPRVLERDGTTVLPESQVARLTAWGTLAASLAFLAVFVLAVVAGGGRGAGPGVGVWAAVLVLVVAVPTVVGVLHRRIRPGELVLDHDTVTLSSWNADRSLAWDDMVEVTMVSTPRRTLVLYARRADDIAQGRAPVGVGEQQARSVADADRALAVSFPHLTGAPDVIAAALAHWRATPAARTELGTAAARDRLSGRPATD
ncbi:hypothetical protein [Nocardioides aurantiacus]|uniref:Uncharacterized protein n=1 Tax=Nocardioides aurantiacus TaxID=86796 RepID=A0A3N2CRD9_9ACTN|nr:hypothetical protein [Nocardioides aurantiacus]ROR90112.1 hypothetical protein EDD33_0947 [Nocardioides aurantiacus]